MRECESEISEQIGESAERDWIAAATRRVPVDVYFVAKRSLAWMVYIFATVGHQILGAVNPLMLLKVH